MNPVLAANAGLAAAPKMWYIGRESSIRLLDSAARACGGSIALGGASSLAIMETPRSLLERLRCQPDETSWKRLVDLYTPLLQRWLRKAGVDGSDADDLMQEVFVAVVGELPSFEHNQHRGAFRYWLRSILANRLRRHWDAKRSTLTAAGAAENLPALEDLEDPASDLNQLWDREHDAFLARRVVQIIENDFNSSTWQAFHRVVLDGAKPAEVAAELGLSVNAVLLAKSRILHRARQEIDGLID